MAAPDPEGTLTLTEQPFGARFAAALAERGQFCVGIDPHAGLLREWGLDDTVEGLEKFALTAVEAVAPYCSVVKPQSAFYERFGSRGVAVLERVIAESRAAGALVLLDVKRGDIGSTSQAYAEAYLDPASPLASDAITISPYLGFGSLVPFVETARLHGAGLFVLAATSNKEGPEVQEAVTNDDFGGRTVASAMLAHLRDLNGGAQAGRLLRCRRRRHDRRSAAWTSRSTGRSSRPGTASRAAPPPTSSGSSVPLRSTSWPARPAACSASVPTRPRCGARSQRANDELRSLLA